MKRIRPSLALLAGLLLASQVGASDQTSGGRFGALEAMTSKTAHAKATAWLKEVGKADPGSLKRLDAIWQDEQRSVLDRLADSFALGNEGAAKLLAESRSSGNPAPVKVADELKNVKGSMFYRANLALAYARNLSSRKVFEESLDVLKMFNPEQVVDPASYLFHRAVGEHALLQKEEAVKSIHRLLDDAVDISPERYKAVSALMLLEMATWKDKDLGTVARKMDNVARRLDLSRGGPETQRQQKEIVARLDEIIKKLENKNKGGGA